MFSLQLLSVPEKCYLVVTPSSYCVSVFLCHPSPLLLRSIFLNVHQLSRTFIQEPCAFKLSNNVSAYDLRPIADIKAGN